MNKKLKRIKSINPVSEYLNTILLCKHRSSKPIIDGDFMIRFCLDCGLVMECREIENLPSDEISS